MNLYTVNAPWLFSLLWCAGVPSVTSDNSHTLSQVPSPLWIMVSWGMGGGAAGPWGCVERTWGMRWGQAPRLGLSGEISSGEQHGRRIFMTSAVCTEVLAGGENLGPAHGENNVIQRP